MEVKRLIMCCYCLKDIEDEFNNNKNKQSKGRGIICVKMSDFYLCYFSAFLNIILLLWRRFRKIRE